MNPSTKLKYRNKIRLYITESGQKVTFLPLHITSHHITSHDIQGHVTSSLQVK